MNHESQLAEFRRRLKNAKRRAVYWSGRPSFTGFGYISGVRGKPRSGHHDSELEMAQDDISALCDAIEKLTGKRPSESIGWAPHVITRCGNNDDSRFSSG